MQRNITSVDIYTDGSFSNNKMGIGILFISKGEVIFKESFRVPGNGEISSRYAEFTAVLMAMNIASKLKIKKVVIYYDYEQIGLIVKGFHFYEDDVVRQFLLVFNELKKEFNEVKFIKVKAHKNKYNIIVDSLAKEAIR